MEKLTLCFAKIRYLCMFRNRNSSQMIHSIQETAAYRYARDAAGVLWDIKDVDDSLRRRKKFFCIGCGGEMDAVIHVADHFFRHTGDESQCSRALYLAGYGRRIVGDRFREATSFPILGTIDRVCPTADSCPMRQRDIWRCGLVCTHRIDLREYYDTCRADVTEQGFHADLLLSSSTSSVEPLAVVFDCGQPSAHTLRDVGRPVIEIELRDEEDAFRSLDETSSVPAVRYCNVHLDERLLAHRVDRFGLFRDTLGHYSSRRAAEGCTCHSVIEHFDDCICELNVACDKPADVPFSSQDMWASLLCRSGLTNARCCSFCAHDGACPETATPGKPYTCASYSFDERHAAAVAAAFERVPHCIWYKSSRVKNKCQ